METEQLRAGAKFAWTRASSLLRSTGVANVSHKKATGAPKGAGLPSPPQP
jgi:hypothetical protein